MNVHARSAAIIAGVVLLDRVTKWAVRSNVSASDVFPVIPGVFNIVHTENPGAAFGMLADYAGEWRGVILIGVSLAVMTVIGTILWRPARMGVVETMLLRTGFALVFGGALGNVWDRVMRGTVTDFLQVFIGRYEFPAFNAADSAITVGAGLLLIDLWRSRTPSRHA